MIFFNFTDWLRKTIDRRPERGRDRMTKKYLRLTLNERFQHLNLMINFVILVITASP